MCSGDGNVFNGAIDVSYIENERATETTILHSQTKAFCLVQGDKWLLSSAKRLNEQDKEVKQEDVLCKRLLMKKAGQK